MIRQKLLFFNSKKPLITDLSYSKRPISIYQFDDVQLTGDSIHYPLTLLHELSSSKHYIPLKEKFMSLGRGVIYEKKMRYNFLHRPIKNVDDNPYFYFIYNNSNYYHFIYDSLPYLWSFFNLKKRIPNIKILTNTPFKEDKNFGFVNDCLYLLGVKKKDIVIANPHTIYNKLYVSSSLTHDGKSNEPPHPNIFKLYKKFNSKKSPSNRFDKIYISRRTWLKKNRNKNIGTDYTLRRQLTNEDELVEQLSSYGFKEIFCEDLNMSKKIELFKNAKYVVGPIGGGMCNLLFSNKNTKVLSINSPLFFKINKRFIFSMKHTKLKHFNDTFFIKNPKASVSGNNALSISGGLNTPWKVDIDKFNLALKNFLS